MLIVPPEIATRLSPDKIVTDFGLLNGRIGLFGGTFDPIHQVHLDIAQELLSSGHVDQVVFIPAAQNPLKTARPVSDLDRLVMILLAIEHAPHTSVSTLELERGQLSYTVETLEQIAGRKRPGAQLFWIIGSDSLAQLPDWREVSRIFNFAEMITIQRDQLISLEQWHEYIDHLALSPENRQQLKGSFVARLPNAVSSTAVRYQLHRGAVPQAVPEAVVDYIKRRNLYR